MILIYVALSKAPRRLLEVTIPHNSEPGTNVEVDTRTCTPPFLIPHPVNVKALIPVVHQPFSETVLEHMQIRILEPLKTCRIVILMHVKSIEAQSPPDGVIWKFGEWRTIAKKSSSSLKPVVQNVWTLVPVRLGKQLSDHSTVDEIASGAADCRLAYTMANCPQRREERPQTADDHGPHYFESRSSDEDYT
ncbi:hypothetical protein TNCV_1111721 [Trichonephila clavipes]|nr:hypothetical protein TNCV_1111721 [Trichonephila clavipes]